MRSTFRICKLIGRCCVGWTICQISPSYSQRAVKQLDSDECRTMWLPSFCWKLVCAVHLLLHGTINVSVLQSDILHFLGHSTWSTCAASFRGTGERTLLQAADWHTSNYWPQPPAWASYHFDFKSFQGWCVLSLQGFAYAWGPIQVNICEKSWI